MPTYEYACSSCQHEWEFEQSIKDNAITECPSCHAQTARRQISRGTGFILKGSGWYADLYSSASNKSGGDSKSSGGSSTPSSSGGTSSGSSEGSSGSSEGSSGSSGSSTPPAGSAPSSTTPV